MKYLLLLLVPFLNPLSALAQNRSIRFEQGTLQQALVKADSAKKLVFVDCYTAWCIPCKGMDKLVFTNDTVADFFNSHFINVKMDMEKGEGPDILKKYKIGAFPTFLLLGEGGNIVYKFVGGMAADTFLTEIKKGIDPENKVVRMDKEYKNGNRSPELLREYIKLKIEIKEIEAGQKISADYLEKLTPKERAAKENWFLFGQNRYSMYLSNIYSSNFNYLADHWKEFIQENGRKNVEDKLASSYRQISEYCLRGWYFKEKPYSKKDFDRYRTQLKTTELQDKDHLVLLIDVADAAGRKDTAKVINILADNIDSFSEENKRILFGFAFMIQRQNRTSPITNSARIREVFEKVVQTSSNEGLVRTAKSYMDKFPAPL